MAFAGLKKQINKANQYVTEKMGGAEGTKLDLDFMEMERKTDVTVELVEELQTKTKEFLQPNPTARAKMAAVKGISKLSGQAKSNTYPQAEGLLADCMLLYGKKLGEDSIFAQSLIEMGESLKQMADVKYSLDDNIKQNVLEPLHHLQTKDLKEVMHHRKKLQGRRLDFDCKRRRQAKGSHITDDEIRGAEEKFAESLHLAQMGMFNLLENDVEQVSQLVTFAEALHEYHEQCTEVLKVLVQTLHEKKEEAESRPKSEFVPKSLNDLNIESISSSTDGINGGRFGNNSTDFNRVRNPSNPLYSSQQNLSNNGSRYGANPQSNNNNGNFTRSKFYGSQQNLQTSVHNSNHSNSNSTNNNYNSRYGSFSGSNNNHSRQSGNVNNNSSNRNVNNNNSGASTPMSPSNAIDPWLNAWDSPTPVVPPPSNASQGGFKVPAPKMNSINNNSNQFVNSNSSASNGSNYHFNRQPGTVHFGNSSDPWSVSKPTHLELTGNGTAQSRSANASPLPSPMRSPARTPVQRPSGPCCEALYDFEPENPGELGFKENDIIQLINKVDENWYEGSVNGRTGYFPQSYVQVKVPLPN